MTTRKVTTSFKKPSRTVHSAAYDADLNNMISGRAPFTQAKSSFYIDETIFPENYEAAYAAISRATDAFMALPPKVREVFQNDPARLSAALADPSTHDQLRELGLLPPIEEPARSAPHKAGEVTAPASEGGSDDTDD